MNRWIRRTVTLGSFAGALALLPSVIAYAQNSPSSTQPSHAGHHWRRGGLLESALSLPSLTAEQRASVEQLILERKNAGAPVRQADAQVLTLLAEQVEQAKIDPQALAPSLGAEQTAAAAEASVEGDLLNKLHALLTPAQRSQLVDSIETARTARADAGRGGGKKGGFGRGLNLTPEQRTEILASLRAGRPDGGASVAKGERTQKLEAFRGDSFDGTSLVHAASPGEHMEKLATAMVPVLSPSQRATFANHLRTRASRESQPKPV